MRYQVVLTEKDLLKEIVVMKATLIRKMTTPVTGLSIAISSIIQAFEYDRSV